jgi:hypothetical protein
VLKARGEEPEEDLEPRGETDIDKGEAEVDTRGRTTREE